MENKDTRIFMIVDTENIKPGEVDKWIEFKDNRKNPKPSKDVVNFTSEISAGQKVFWFGEPKEGAGDSIEITGIEKKKQDEPEFLEEIGKEPGNNRVFMARVKGTYSAGLESYNIKFRIKENQFEFEVDPKLKMEI